DALPICGAPAAPGNGRARRLAVALPGRGAAGRGTGRDDVPLSARSAVTCALAQRVRAGVARRDARNGAAGARAHPAALVVAGADARARVASVSPVLLDHHQLLRRGILAAANRPELRRAEQRGRL